MRKRILERFFQIPAETLEKGVETSERVGKEIINKKPFKRAEEYWNTLGPGLTTGAADDDPSGITTYSQAGAQYGLTYLWLAAYTFPVMAVVQEMCARIGLVTGQGLAANIRKHYPKEVLYLATALLFVANSFNIGADLGAMAKAVQLLAPHISFSWLVVLFAFVTLLLQIFTTYARYARYLKYLALVLLTYIVSGFIVELNVRDVLWYGFLPSFTFSKDAVLIVCGVLGTTISPYLFFWQTSQEVEEEILAGKTTVASRLGTNAAEMFKMRVDVWSGMFFSNLVMFFIIAVCAATLFAHGVTNIATAADAAAALRPLAGNLAFFLFSLGIIGTGLLAIPVLAGSASYAISESFGWRYGLYRKLKQAYAFYGVIIVAMLIGLAINFTGIDPIKALIYSAVLNGLIAPLILVLIIRLSSDRKIMGQWASGPKTRVAGWAITAAMALAGLATIVSAFV